YLADTRKYFVYPLKSFTYQSGAKGTHHKGNVKYKGTLQLFEKAHVFKPLKNSSLKYDAYFQVEAQGLQEVVAALQKYRFYVDFYGLKNPDEQTEEFVLTYSKSQSSKTSFSAE